jgi:hypothetical protein
MKLHRATLTSLILGVAFAGTACLAFHPYLGTKMTKVHTLAFPLLLSSAAKHGPFQLLPKGTTLYLDRTYPEGFTRYIVYVNVDRFPLPTRESSDPTVIDPLTAYAMDPRDLKRLLEANPVTKEELAGILKSGQLSKEEIREVLAEYAK